MPLAAADAIDITLMLPPLVITPLMLSTYDTAIIVLRLFTESQRHYCHYGRCRH